MLLGLGVVFEDYQLVLVVMLMVSALLDSPNKAINWFKNRVREL